MTETNDALSAEELVNLVITLLRKLELESVEITLDDMNAAIDANEGLQMHWLETGVTLSRYEMPPLDDADDTGTRH